MVGQKLIYGISPGNCYNTLKLLWRDLGCALVTLMQYLNLQKKLSKRPPQMSQIDAFPASLEFCHLEDLGFKGYPFTWNNNRPGDANTKLKFDRAVATKDWRDKF